MFINKYKKLEKALSPAPGFKQFVKINDYFLIIANFAFAASTFLLVASIVLVVISSSVNLNKILFACFQDLFRKLFLFAATNEYH